MTKANVWNLAFARTAAIHLKRMSSTAESEVQYISSISGEPIAFRQSLGKHPGVVFLPGLMSNMEGTKATALERYCREIGHSYVRFDYRGHGMSGGKSEECTIGMRKEDVLTILDNVAKGPQILVGSSLGGWVMLLVAMARPGQIKGLLGVASAVDFLCRHYDRLPDSSKKDVESTGKWVIPSQYSPNEPYVLDLNVIQEARKYILPEGEVYPVHCPVRLIHGMQDKDVPYQVSLDLVKRLASSDVRVTLIKDGTHRLSDELNVQLLTGTLGCLIKHLNL
ncbi:palmitoyl-protein thioesterase ABHD10, mitochondrial-like [Montipora capricornis]|uniref:palmitoyl-protein thioesterase ABHD10, mitochondrial-like n=1 Tax=Montipora capricornis TaxID=246305 RepID=UPI0035F17E94